MFDLSFILESMAKIISALWEAFVDPIKPVWIILIVVFAIVILFPRRSRAKFGR